MEIKRGQYTLFCAITMFDIVLFIVSLFSFLLGFEKNCKSILLFCGIFLGLIVTSVIIYVLVSHFIKHRYVFDDYKITYLRNDNILKCWYYVDILKAEYVKFSAMTIIDQRSFGYLKIKFIDESEIVFSVALRQIKKINVRYFNVKIKK